VSPPAPGAAWDDAPSGLLTLRTDGTVLAANATFLTWAGRAHDDVVGKVRLSELLSVGGRIYWETHLSPLLLVERRIDEVALELRGPDGRLPVLLTAVVAPDGDVVHAALSSARDRALFERELVAARAAAERSAARLQALQQVTAGLSGAVGVEGVAAALLTSAVGPLGAAAGTLWLSDSRQQLVRHAARGEPADAAALPAAGVLLRERTAVATEGRVVVPLHGSSTLQGVLSLAPHPDPAADPLDLEVLTAVGQQAGLALDRAQLYEQSASVAHELQRSLLAAAPPHDPRFTVATVYRPGVEMLEVGGDWHDVFLAEEGVLSVVVGDVVGRGLGAASAMGQLRSAVRAVAGPDVGPARLLSRLDRFVEQVEAAGMATLAYAELELATGLLRYACAGHPPPLLLPVAGPPVLLWDGRSTPLGAFLVARERTQAEVQLAPGDRLLLFTDGLVERRDRPLDAGLDLLRRAAGELAGQGLDDAVRSLTDRLLQDERGRDDVCVLLLSWSGTSFTRQLSADLQGLGAFRADLGGWLRDRDVDETTTADVVLAASEAVANAAEHGVRRRPTAEVRVRVRLEDPAGVPRSVVVEVEDSGRWRPPKVSAERGRGLQIIEALVDDVSISTGDGTTVVLRRDLRREAS
jgi:serine phosphatase RsbU (regulator of sigma subunit)/anti-sigma regulatory factor (Ser/Thr protein kinase)